MSNRMESYSVMNNSKLFVSAIWLLGLTFVAPLTTEAARSGGSRGGGQFDGMSRGGFSRGGMGPYGARWSGGNWNRTGTWNRNLNGANLAGRNNLNGAHLNSAGGQWRNSNGRWGWWNGHRFVHARTNVVFIGGFGFPWWWGWGWGPWAGWGWGWGYPYGYYGYGDPYYGGYGNPYYGYGNGYGGQYQSQYGYGGQYQSQYGDSSQSRVAELQRRLQRAGYYHGSIDGVLGPQTRSAIRAYEQKHGDVG